MAAGAGDSGQDRRRRLVQRDVAEAAWGRYWGWDPKETWAFITWVAYAAYLHACATAGWKGRRAAVLGLMAFATFVFNYYGVKSSSPACTPMEDFR